MHNKWPYFYLKQLHGNFVTIEKSVMRQWQFFGVMGGCHGRKVKIAVGLVVDEVVYTNDGLLLLI